MAKADGKSGGGRIPPNQTFKLYQVTHSNFTNFKKIPSELKAMNFALQSQHL